MNGKTQEGWIIVTCTRVTSCAGGSGITLTSRSPGLYNICHPDKQELFSTLVCRCLRMFVRLCTACVNPYHSFSDHIPPSISLSLAWALGKQLFSLKAELYSEKEWLSSCWGCAEHWACSCNKEFEYLLCIHGTYRGAQKPHGKAISKPLR